MNNKAWAKKQKKRKEYRSKPPRGQRAKMRPVDDAMDENLKKFLVEKG